MNRKGSVAAVVLVVTGITTHIGFSQDCVRIVPGISQTGGTECESYTTCMENDGCDSPGYNFDCGEVGEADRTCAIFGGGCWNPETGRCEDGQPLDAYYSGKFSYFFNPTTGCDPGGGGN